MDGVFHRHVRGDVRRDVRRRVVKNTVQNQKIEVNYKTSRSRRVVDAVIRARCGSYVVGGRVGR